MNFNSGSIFNNNSSTINNNNNNNNINNMNNNNNSNNSTFSSPTRALSSSFNTNLSNSTNGTNNLLSTSFNSINTSTLTTTPTAAITTTTATTSTTTTNSLSNSPPSSSSSLNNNNNNNNNASTTTSQSNPNNNNSNSNTNNNNNNNNTTSIDNITIYIQPVGIQLPPGTTLPPFLMKKYTLFKKLFSHISQRFNIEENSLIFIYHDVVDPEDCPNDIGLNSDETIIVRKKLLKNKPKNPTLFEKNIASLFYNPIYSDISFRLLDDSIINAHKNILSSRCQKFQGMFQVDMKESQQKEIEIVNYEPAVFRKMIEYIYSDSLKEDNIEMILQLIVIADEYLLDSLKSVCEMMLVSEISFNNIALFLLKSDMYNCKILKKSSMDFALANVKKLIDDKEFIDIIKESPPLLLEIIHEMAPVYDCAKKKTFPINNS